MASIPLGDASALRVAGNRARASRAALLVGLGATAIAALFVARTPSAPPTPLLPPGSSGIIILDISNSVGQRATLDRMYAGLSQLAAGHSRFGLVLFSDRAYEALPPDTPAIELKSFARFFRKLPPGSVVSIPGRPPPSGAALYPTNPWTAGFSRGTEVSKGLELARSIILASGPRHQSVWLMSDLSDDPNDRSAVIRAANSYISSGIALHVIGLDATANDQEFFERLLGPRGSLVAVQPSTHVRLQDRSGFPFALGVLAVALALLLSANELWGTPLRWGTHHAYESAVDT
jgi:hypothetical protein